uniref:Uncharacterized protein n=1 Tax=Amphimedon queenslandica TaxID=400682 RepID=A0A1X7SP07_AMPQE
EKLDRIYQVLAEWLKKAWCFRQDLESLVCVLQQATRHICLNREFKADLHWWVLLLQHWNMALFTQPCRQTVMVTSDASGLPQRYGIPSPIPLMITELVFDPALDWASGSLMKLFSSIVP